ncbi:hypothetical protein BTW10_02565 [Chromohalobacter japonicus]|uniref:Succinate dehydrogenase n=1 Tax=Chromohalobacter japonicus TaxID=223900 RepID=A0A1Q8TFH5_9GAMM|nr:FAD-binding protein [Chromohalobacter japonicus]OLO12378.1 hypothetical protein BTW10_02565 [Chromohalobacter japonicus]
MPPSMRVETIQTDVLVVGGGGAASRAALSAAQAGAKVRMACKAPLLQGGSTVHGASEIMSMGAAAGFGDPNDSPEIHYQDTMRAAEGFIDPELVRVLASDAPERIRDLLDMGLKPDQTIDGNVKLIQSDFGSYARCVGVSGKTGKAFVTAMARELQRMGVMVDTPMSLVDIVRDNEGSIAGAVCLDTERQLLVHYQASSVILGTGGMHGVFSQQVSTPEMTGDGQAICYRHGAELVNLEFHQFGPALVHPYIQLFSKSCFVLYPTIRNANGDLFLSRYLPDGVSAEEVMDEKVFPFTTSNVSRYLDIAIAHEINEGRGGEHGGVYFTFEGVPESKIEATIPNTVRWMRSKGVNPLTDRFEVGIAFQCMNGGVRMVNTQAESSITGLYVIGEVAGGVRGPDRPGGNSLAEGQVFGHRAGTAAAERSKKDDRPSSDKTTFNETLNFVNAILERGQPQFDMNEAEHLLRETMQTYCLVEKDEPGLKKALSIAEGIAQQIDSGLAATPSTLSRALSLRNMVDASSLVLKACIQRKETRSGHFRTDFPVTDDAHYQGAFIWKKAPEGLRSWQYTYAMAE